MVSEGGRRVAPISYPIIGRIFFLRWGVFLTSRIHTYTITRIHEAKRPAIGSRTERLSIFGIMVVFQCLVGATYQSIAGQNYGVVVWTIEPDSTASVR